jgi:hypothetical protein
MPVRAKWQCNSCVSQSLSAKMPDGQITHSWVFQPKCSMIKCQCHPGILSIKCLTTKWHFGWNSDWLTELIIFLLIIGHFGWNSYDSVIWSFSILLKKLYLFHFVILHFIWHSAWLTKLSFGHQAFRLEQLWLRHFVRHFGWNNYESVIFPSGILDETVMTLSFCHQAF